MQRIAREMNLSETVFLLPRRVRAGTRRRASSRPRASCPSRAIRRRDRLVPRVVGRRARQRDGVSTIVLEENVGPIPVEVRMKGGQPEFARFTTAVLPEYRSPGLDRAECARLLSLAEDEIGAPGWEPEMVSCGLPFFILPVRDLDALGARASTRPGGRASRGRLGQQVYPITPRPSESGLRRPRAHVRTRRRHAEDPATGSGRRGPRRLPGQARVRRRHAPLAHRAGVEMGRPSLIDARGRRDGRQGRAVRRRRPRRRGEPRHDGRRRTGR
jgi:trans-2,3-dihydro-3-hydroxyanthranilate isomerase